VLLDPHQDAVAVESFFGIRRGDVDIAFGALDRAFGVTNA
jgi:hypothetical protein